MKKPAKKTTKSWIVDGKTFASPSLAATYSEWKGLQQSGLIRSFELPEGKPEKNKFHAIKCRIDEIDFDSVMEARYYIHLLQQIQRKIVKSFECQPVFLLQDKFVKFGKTVRPITYVADFLVRYENGAEKAIDVKGRITKDFALKRKLFDFRYRNIELELTQYRVKTQDWVKVQ